MHYSVIMTASTHTITPIRRRRAIHPFPQEKLIKQSASFVRMNTNEEEMIKEEFACEQSSSEHIFRLSSRRAKEADLELVQMWNLKRASPTDGRLGR
jgi:hypothetical protein